MWQVEKLPKEEYEFRIRMPGEQISNDEQETTVANEKPNATTSTLISAKKKVKFQSSWLHLQVGATVIYCARLIVSTKKFQVREKIMRSKGVKLYYRMI